MPNQDFCTTYCVNVANSIFCLNHLIVLYIDVVMTKIWIDLMEFKAITVENKEGGFSHVA